MRCPKCGAVIKEGQMRCPVCGFEIEEWVSDNLYFIIHSNLLPQGFVEARLKILGIRYRLKPPMILVEGPAPSVSLQEKEEVKIPLPEKREGKASLKFFKILTWINIILIGAASLLFSSGGLILIAGGKPEGPGVTLLGLAFIGYLISIIPFFIWVYKANVNAKKVVAEKMRFSPGEAVAYFFIPIVNLIYGFRVMSEIYNASKDPQTYTPQKYSSTIVGLWWLLYIVGNISFQIYEKGGGLQILGAGLMLFSIAGFLLVAIMVKVLKFQEKAYSMGYAEISSFAPEPSPSSQKRTPQGVSVTALVFLGVGILLLLLGLSGTHSSNLEDISAGLGALSLSFIFLVLSLIFLITKISKRR